MSNRDRDKRSDTLSLGPPGPPGAVPRPPWQDRLRALLASHGYSSLGGYADANPLASLDALADALGIADIGAVQLEGQLLREAVQERQIDRRARDLLSRRLASLPGGWPGPPKARNADEETRSMQALASWFPIGFATEYQVAIIKVALEMLSHPELARGWRPSGPNDPVLVRLFEKHWQPF